MSPTGLRYASRFPARAIFATLAVEQGLDVLTTKWALGQGNHEANPTVAPYVHLPLAVLLITKVGLALGAYAVWRWAERRQVRRTGSPVAPLLYLPLMALTGLYAYIITNNLAIYLATRH